MKQIISNFNSNSQGLCTRFAAIFPEFLAINKGKKKKHRKFVSKNTIQILFNRQDHNLMFPKFVVNQFLALEDV